MKKMLKNSIALFLFIMILFASLFTVSASEADSVLAFTVSADGFAVVSDCADDAEGFVSVPAECEIGGITYKVKYIGEKAFDGCAFVTKVEIPEGVTAIRNFAFRNCTSLEEVYIPESLIMCQYDVFEGCENVTIHCYESNYQFFTVYGISSGITVDILDYNEEPDEDETTESDNNASDNIITRLINALQKLVNDLMEYFGANDDDFEFDFNLPFGDGFDFGIDF